MPEVSARISGHGDDGHLYGRPPGCGADAAVAVPRLFPLGHRIADGQAAQRAVTDIGHDGLRGVVAAEAKAHPKPFRAHLGRLDHAKLITGRAVAVRVQHRPADQPGQVRAAQVQPLDVAGPGRVCAGRNDCLDGAGLRVQRRRLRRHRAKMNRHAGAPSTGRGSRARSSSRSSRSRPRRPPPLRGSSSPRRSRRFRPRFRSSGPPMPSRGR